ncbi:MAG: nucleotidyltransferase family protein, partial [Rhizobiales bacterium]|nr:nucleotidyltransferase family protein [Hyphomicrobiales bacterium]
LDRLANAGVVTAAVNVHYLADQLISHLSHRDRPATIICDERDALLDTGGGAMGALGVIGERPFFTVNTDSVWVEGARPALATLAQHFDPVRMDCVMLLASVVTTIGYDGPGDFSMDETGLIERRAERPAVPFVYTGVSIVHPRLFEGAPDGAFSMNLLWDRALEAGRCFGVRHDGMWMHVGTPEALAAAEVAMSVNARA